MVEIRNTTAALRANKRQGSIMTLCSVWGHDIKALAAGAPPQTPPPLHE